MFTDSDSLAPYAMRDEASAGRRHPEPGHPFRGPFQRDRDRIIHCSAFRRLSNKTQVFTGEMGDYPRTRLTHTLEVASVARTLGRALRLNEDLIEALALAHDLGHPPFGHAGEETLDHCLIVDGGFCHNRQALRVVEELEQRYPDFPGLNLSLEILESQAARAAKEAEPKRALLEAQVVDAADGVAYNTHDADDALEVGLLTLGELLELPLWREAARRVEQRYGSLAANELKRAVLRELVDWQVSDLLEQTAARLATAGIDSLKAVRSSPPLVGHSAEVGEQKTELEAFLHQRVYRHPQVLAVRGRVQAELEEMFNLLVAQPERLPPGFRARLAKSGLRRTVGDYLAGMTDRYARQQYRVLTGESV